MGDGPQTEPRKARWAWLRALTLVLWAGLVLSAATLASGFLVAEHVPGSYSVFHFLFGVSVWLMLGLLPVAPMSILLHVMALFKQRIAAKTAYFGMVSGAVLIIGDLVLMAYAGSRLG